VRGLVLSCLLVMVWDPTSAAAATVAVEPCGSGSRYCLSAVVVVAEPGELNRIRVAAEPSVIEVSDVGAPPRAGEGCSVVDPNTVLCEAAAGLRVAAGDGDDRVEFGGEELYFVALTGGPGDDLLIGAGSDEWIGGGTGADQLLGGAGDDELSDGDADGERDADVIDGGPGVDVVDYSSRTAPVTVRLDALGRDEHAGEAGEKDRLIAVEGAWGGGADDVLRVGDAGASPSRFHDIGDVPGLAGGPGDHVLIGGRGTDRIDASEGADRVRSGPGDDDMELPYDSTRRGARVDCGGGFDIVGYAAPSDRLVRNCNLIYVGEYETAFAPAAASSGDVRVREVEQQTRVTVVADGGRLDGRLIARRTFRARPGRLGLTALGRRLAQRGQLPAIRVRCRAGARAPRQGFRLTPRSG
jgi:Ca2+-binding RTX toxin-like protein